MFWLLVPDAEVPGVITVILLETVSGEQWIAVDNGLCRAVIHLAGVLFHSGDALPSMVPYDAD